METVKTNSDLKVFLESNDIVLKLRPLLKSILQELKQEIIQPEKYLTRNEVAKLLGVSLPTVDKLTKNGILSSYKVPGSTIVRYLQSEIPYAFKPGVFKLENKQWKS